jgi:cytochrome P450
MDTEQSPQLVREGYLWGPRVRRGAFPPPIKLVLFGPGTVHGLDDDEHRTRNAMLLGVLTPARVAELASRAEQQWAQRTAQWPGRDRVVLFDEAVQVLGTSVLRWAGVPEGEDLAGARPRWPRWYTASASRARRTRAPSSRGCSWGTGRRTSCAGRATVSSTRPPGRRCTLPLTRATAPDAACPSTWRRPSC